MQKTMLVLASVAFTLGACSSSDGDDATSGSDPSSTDASDTTEAEAEAEDPDNEFCQVFEDFDTPGNEPSSQAEMVAAFDDLADAAPDSIRGDLETLRDAFSEMAELDAASADDPEALEEFLAVLSRPEVEEASTNVEAYTVDVCDLDSSTANTVATVDVPELSLPDVIEE